MAADPVKWLIGGQFLDLLDLCISDIIKTGCFVLLNSLEWFSNYKLKRVLYIRTDFYCISVGANNKHGRLSREW